MKAKVTIIVLVAACLGLGGALWYQHNNYNQAPEPVVSDSGAVQKLTNEVAKVATTLGEQRVQNQSLSQQLTKQIEENKSLSNELANVSLTLVRAQTEAKAATEAIDAVKATLKDRDTKIQDLEEERESLSKRMVQLQDSIGALENAITDTKRRLATSEGDRDFLTKQLNSLQAEKAELEGKFRNLAVLREQVRKVREEMVIARRREWTNRGLSGNLKGGELLQRGFASTPAPAKIAPASKGYDLNVEIKRDGAARTGTTTTEPAPKPPSP